tara:strand:- start:279 stop:776 length:498 start_codon:yes stop_codon:yes gene_type:complete
MNKVYCKRINQIRAEIKAINASINNGDTYVHSPKKPKASDDPEYRSFALKKFQSTYNYKTFKRREKAALRALGSKYETKVERIEDMGKFMDAKIQEELRGISSWNKLDKWQKTNRIEEYLHRYMEENDVDINMSDMKKKLSKISGKEVIWGDGIIVEIKTFHDYL